MWLVQLEPRDRAEVHVTLARAVDVLFRMQWRACGVDEDKREWKETVRCPQCHPEFGERLSEGVSRLTELRRYICPGPDP